MRRISVVAVIDVALLLGVAGCSWLWTNGVPGDPPRSIRVGGDRLPYAGPVPWRNPVTDHGDPRVVDVFADGDNVGHGICGLPTERVHVSETSRAVTVLVAGYGRSVNACGGVGHALQRHQVRLARPLGSRQLLDASDGQAHVILDSVSVPTLTGVPAGYRQAPLSWDEGSGRVDRSWQVPSSSQPPVILLSRAPAGVIEEEDGPINPRGPSGDRVATGVDVAGHPANVWDYPYLYGEIVTVRWMGAGGLEQQLVTSVPVGGHLGVDDALALARSITTPVGG